MKEIRGNIFKNKSFMLLWISNSISVLGDEIHSLAVMWYVMQKTGSALEMGTSLVFTQLPIILLSPFAGVLADRMDRKKILVVSDFLSSLVVGIICFLAFTGNLQIWELYCLSAALSTIGTFFSPCMGAIIPSIVEEDNLMKANSLRQFVTGTFTILGPSLGGVLIALTGVYGLFLVNSISFLLACIIEMFAKIPKVERELEKQPSSKLTAFIEDLKEGFAYAIKNKKLLHYIIVGCVIINFFTAPISIFVPLYVKDVLHEGSKSLGIAYSCISIGGIIVTVIYTMFHLKFRYYLVTIGLTCEGLFMVAFSMSNNYVLSLISLVFLGASFGICNVSLGTAFQKLIPNNIMGRVNSILSVFAAITVPLGFYFGGVFVERFNVIPVLAVSGIIVAISGVSTISVAISKVNGNREAAEL